MSHSRQLTLTDIWGRVGNNNRIMEDNSETEEWDKTLKLHENDLTIASINIGDRIQNKLNNIINSLEQMHPLVLVLCEVHSFQEDIEVISEIFNRKGFTFISNLVSKRINDYSGNSFKRKNPKGGIAMLINNTIYFKNVKCILDNRGIIVTLKINNEWIDLLGLYAPSTCETNIFRNEWWKEAASTIVSCRNKKIIIGDLNIHLNEELDHRTDNTCQWPDELDTILSLVIDVWRVKHPITKLHSYMKNTLSSRIDYALIDPNINMDIEIFYAPLDPLLSADHRLVGLWINKTGEFTQHYDSNNSLLKLEQINTKKFKDTDTQKEYMKETSLFKPDLNRNNIDQSNNSLVDFIKLKCKNIIGHKVRNIHNNKNKVPKRILLLAINVRRLKHALSSFPLAVSSKIISKAMYLLNHNRRDLQVNLPITEDNNWLEWRNETIIKLKIASKELRKITRKFEKDKIRKAVNRLIDLEIKNPKIFNRKFNWRKINQHNNINKLILENDRVTSNPEEIEETLVNYWKNIFKSRLNSKSEMDKEDWFKTKFTYKTKELIASDQTLLREISIEEVEQILNSMGKNKAPGIDTIPLEAFVHASKEIKIELTYIFNKCLSEGNIPKVWKESKLFLIFKGGKESPENFRPIALLNTIYKTFSALINRRLNKLLLDKKIIHNHQSGFQKNRSTSTRIWSLISIIKHQTINNNDLNVLYLDIKKAYDSVEHWALVNTLKILGFQERFCTLIQNIYSNTSFAISTIFGESEQHEITRGVKQGCPLSPTLFNLFIEPLLAWLEESKLGIKINTTVYTVGGFADDLVVTTDSHEKMIELFNKINIFINYYSLELNVDGNNKNKTVYTSFKPNDNLIYKCVDNNQIIIPYIESFVSYKYLGININLDLNWEKQRNISWNIFQRQIAFLHNRCISVKQIIKILNSIVIPTLNYSLQFIYYPNKWLARMERLIAILISKYLHIPEASPFHFQRQHLDASYNLQSIKMNQQCIPIQSYFKALYSVIEKFKCIN